MATVVLATLAQHPFAGRRHARSPRRPFAFTKARRHAPRKEAVIVERRLSVDVRRVFATQILARLTRHTYWRDLPLPIVTQRLARKQLQVPMVSAMGERRDAHHTSGQVLWWNCDAHAPSAMTSVS